MLFKTLLMLLRVVTALHVYIYRIAGFCREDFNLAIGPIRDIKIRDHFIIHLISF